MCYMVRLSLSSTVCFFLGWSFPCFPLLLGAVVRFQTLRKSFKPLYLLQGTLRDLFTIESDTSYTQTAAKMSAPVEKKEVEEALVEEPESADITVRVEVSNPASGGKESQTLLEQV